MNPLCHQNINLVVIKIAYPYPRREHATTTTGKTRQDLSPAVRSMALISSLSQHKKMAIMSWLADREHT